jgi:hypothetical protein
MLRYLPYLLLLAAAPDAPEQAALERISALNMKANLSFLASDAMEGRDTPSQGLDIAAEFIASRFRKAGLEPVAGDSYFQKAPYSLVTTDLTAFDLTLEDGTVQLHVTKNFDLQTESAVDLKGVALVKVSNDSPGDLTGKAALIEVPSREKFSEYQKMLTAVRAAHPAVILILPRASPRRVPVTRLVPETLKEKSPPITIGIRDAAAEKFLSGQAPITVSVHAKAPVRKPVELRNVAGLLRGSDPALRDTYVLITAHYDHIGTLPPGEGDRINNGANDDGSGTVSVIEIAEALAQIPQHPKRSILFMTFFGEEKGLFGSRYYAAHPLFPLKQTVAQINLEQLGRTDDNDGPQVASATFTGFDFSDLPATFEQAGKATGVRVYKNEKSSDAFFARSDNQSLADAGVPAHTLAVAFEFPDYHKPGDEWQKIDYENMAKVDRMVALGLLSIANSTAVPHWNAENPKTEQYRKAAAQ